MRTLRVAMLALGLAALATGCGKKKDTATPATTEPAAESGGEEANPCGGGEEANPCGEAANPCGASADPCGGDE